MLYMNLEVRNRELTYHRMKVILLALFFMKSFILTALYSYYNYTLSSEWIMFLALLITSIFYLSIFRKSRKRTFKHYSNSQKKATIW
jgi:preprotein translocase subunit SecG